MKQQNRISWERAILWATACSILALGSVIIWAWGIKSHDITYIKATYPPMVPNTALCFVLSGLSLIFFLLPRPQRVLAILTAFCLLLITSLTICEYIFNIDLGVDHLFASLSSNYPNSFPGRIAPNTTTCFLLMSFCLILTVFPYKHYISLWVEILCGAITSIAGISLFGYLTGQSQLNTWSHFEGVGMALHTSLGILAFAIGVFNYHLLSAFHKEKFIYGPTIAAFVLITGITITLWDNFQFHKHKTLQSLTQNAADFIAENVKVSFTDLSKALNRIVARGEVLSGYDKELWDVDINNYITEFKGIKSIAWYDESLQPQRKSGESNIKFEDLQKLHTLEDTSEQLKNQINYTRIDGHLLLIIHSSSQKFPGFLVTDLNVQDWLNDLTPKITFDNYALYIYVENYLIYQTEGANFLGIGDSAFSKIKILSEQWKIQVFPTVELLEALESYLPTLILFLGFFSAVLVSLSIFLFQIAYASKRKTIQALKEKEEALAYRQAILDSSNYSIISTDTNGIIVSFNPAAEKMLLWRAEEMVRKQTPKIFHDANEMASRALELEDSFKTPISSDFDVFVFLAKKGRVDEREWTYIRKDKTRFPVRLSVSAVQTASGQIVGFVGIAYDLTALKELDRMKNELIAITSHEIRSPLTAIKGSIDLLRESSHSLDDNKISLINIAQKNTDRLLKLTNDILDLQKMESGKNGI